LSETKDQREPKIQFIEPPNKILRTYTNTIHLDWTAYDIRIRFSEVCVEPILKTPGVKMQTVEERVSVAMPWSKAKELRDALIGAVTQYENTNGEIKIPDLPE
jgi:hypothetical protein